jgi:hypothetical protein
MARWSFCHCVLLVTVLLIACQHLAQAQTEKSNEPLSVEDVVNMSQAGVSEASIIDRIKKNRRPFDLNLDEIADLRKAGLSDTIIRFLQDPSQPYTPPPPATSVPGAPPKKYPNDAYASNVPGEAGLYLFPQGALRKIDITMLFGSEKGKKKIMKIPLKQGQSVAYLIGPAAKTRIKEATPTFYLRLPEGKEIDEVALVTLQTKTKANRREITMGPGGPQITGEDAKNFDKVEVGPRLFRITAGRLAQGEYMFLLRGSSEPPKGNYGKGFDFGIDGPSS